MKTQILAAAMALTMGVSAIPQKSQAFGIVNLMSTGRLDYVGVPRTYNDMVLTTICIALLPFCILQDGTGANEVLSYENLLANGYTISEAKQVLAGHNEVVERVVAAGASADQKAIIADVAAYNAMFADFVSNQ